MGPAGPQKYIIRGLFIDTRRRYQLATKNESKSAACTAWAWHGMDRWDRHVALADWRAVVVVDRSPSQPSDAREVALGPRCLN